MTCDSVWAVITLIAMSTTTSGGGAPTTAREAIRTSGHSQRHVAAMMRIDETKLSKSLSGARRFTDDELVDLARITGVTVSDLLGATGQLTAVSVTPPDASSAGPAPSSPEQARRHREIVGAAWGLFAQKGFDAVRISDIAAAGGVSSATVHYYFPTKPDLFSAALSHSVKLAHDRQIARLSGVEDPVERLWKLLEMQSPQGEAGRLDWSIWIQTWNRVALDGGTDQEYVDTYRRWSETVRGAITAGQAADVVRSGSSEVMADELTSLVDGLGIKVLTGVLGEETMQRRLIDHLQRHILSPGVTVPRV